MPELTFRYSLAKALKLLAAGSLLEAGCIWIVWGHPTNPTPDTITFYVSYFGVWFFGAGLIVALINLLLSGKAVVLISTDGFRDKRLFRGIIPWDAIIEVSLYKPQSRVLGVHLTLDPKFVPELHYNRLPGLRRFSDKLLTKTGLIITALELNTDDETLLAAIEAHLPNANTLPLISNNP
jgi:hypothetical protein